MTIRLAGVAVAAAFLISRRVGWPTIPIAYVLATAAEIVLAYISRPFDLRVSNRLTARMAVAAAALGIAAAVFSGWAGAIVLLAGAALIMRLVQSWVYHRPGALTPAGMAITGLLVETFTLSYLQKVPFSLD